MSVHMQSDLVSTGLTVVAASTALVSIGYASICIAEIFVLHGKQMSCNDFFLRTISRDGFHWIYKMVQNYFFILQATLDSQQK